MLSTQDDQARARTKMDNVGDHQHVQFLGRALLPVALHRRDRRPIEVPTTVVVSLANVTPRSHCIASDRSRVLSLDGGCCTAAGRRPAVVRSLLGVVAVVLCAFRLDAALSSCG